MKTIKFPREHSVGKVLITKSKYNGTWSKAIPAQGTIKIPENKYVSFWVDYKFASDLSFCSSIRKDDLTAFIAASSGKYFTDSQMKNIVHFSNLYSLQLWETDITDESLKYINQFPKLGYLGLDTSKITDTGLAHLEGCSSLRKLSIYNNKINGEGVRCLINLKLISLELLDTDINDNSIQFIQQMKYLRKLDIRETYISTKGYKELKKSLPNCDIRFGNYFKNKI